MTHDSKNALGVDHRYLIPNPVRVDYYRCFLIYFTVLFIKHVTEIMMLPQLNLISYTHTAN